MASRHFCHILFIRCESIDPAHTPGEGITEGASTRNRGSLGATLESASPDTVFQEQIYNGLTWVDVTLWEDLLKSYLFRLFYL